MFIQLLSFMHNSLNLETLVFKSAQGGRSMRSITSSILLPEQTILVFCIRQMAAIDLVRLPVD